MKKSIPFIAAVLAAVLFFAALIPSSIPVAAVEIEDDVFEFHGLCVEVSEQTPQEVVTGRIMPWRGTDHPSDVDFKCPGQMRDAWQ